MPIINRSVSRSASRNFRALFYRTLERTAAQLAVLRDLVLPIRSNSPEETMAFLKGIPKMREWVGDRKIKSIAEASFNIKKKDWEATISVNRDHILYDRLNLVRPSIESFAQSFAWHYLDLILTLILGGFAATGYDNQFFFDTDHDNGAGGSYSNKSVAVFSLTEWNLIRNRPAALRNGAVDNDDSRYLAVRWTHILYGSQAESAVEEVFAKTLISGGETNVNYNRIPAQNRHMIPEFGDSGKFFLFDLSKPIKPFILLINKGVDFVAMDDPKDFNVFNQKEFIYGIDSIDNANYALWELAFGSTAGE